MKRTPTSILFPTTVRPKTSTTIFSHSSPSKSSENVEVSSPSSEDEWRQNRISSLHKQLNLLGIDPDHLSNAVYKSMTTMEGNDPYYGKSAIKTYKTFVYPKQQKDTATTKEDIEIAASRTARQIDFLAKRNRSHEAQFVRHTDTIENNDQQQEQGHDIPSTKKRVFPLVLLLDNVRSAFNVGSIFRTADACGVAMIITTGITPNPHGNGREKLAKSALNADRFVTSKHFLTTKEAVEFLREDFPELELIGMETTEWSQCYTNVKYKGGGRKGGKNGLSSDTKGTVLVLGNEVTGVDTEIMPLLDKMVEIPMFGTKNSLNIAACAPVVMYEILRQWGVMDSNDKDEEAKKEEK